MATKDEALRMAIEALDNACIKIEKWTKGGKWTAGKEALAKCKEALEHQEVGDAEIKQMLNDIEYYQKRVEELEQPLTRDWKETIDERIAKDDKFKVALAQPAQEPVAIVTGHIGLSSLSDTINKMLPINTELYTHPAPSWQGLSSNEVELIEMKSYTLQVSVNDYEFCTIAFYEGIEQALKQKNT